MLVTARAKSSLREGEPGIHHGAISRTSTGGTSKAPILPCPSKTEESTGARYNLDQDRKLSHQVEIRAANSSKG